MAMSWSRSVADFSRLGVTIVGGITALAGSSTTSENLNLVDDSREESKHEDGTSRGESSKEDDDF